MSTGCFPFFRQRQVKSELIILLLEKRKKSLHSWFQFPIGEAIPTLECRTARFSAIMLEAIFSQVEPHFFLQPFSQHLPGMRGAPTVCLALPQALSATPGAHSLMRQTDTRQMVTSLMLGAVQPRGCVTGSVCSWKASLSKWLLN